MEKLVLEYLSKFADMMIAHTCGIYQAYKGNIEHLNDSVAGLVAKRDEVKLTVVEVTVESGDFKNLFNRLWIKKADEILDKAEGVLMGANRVDNDKRCFRELLNLKRRYILSRRASILSGVLYSHRQRLMRNFMIPSSVLPSVDSSELDFHRSTIDVLLNYLKNDYLNVIGLCGMPGVGKKWLVNKVVYILLEQKMMVDVVFIVDYNKLSVEDIQDIIAQSLGLKLDETDIGGRARKIRRLMDGSRGLVVVLDGVVEKPQLDQIGIPYTDCASGHGGMSWGKLIIISNEEYAPSFIQAQKYVIVEPHPPIEAWILLKAAAGECIENNELRSSAQDILNKCGGLPSKIVYVGKLLRDLDPHHWHHQKGARDYLHELSAVISHPGIGNRLRDCHSDRRYRWEDVRDYFDELAAIITYPANDPLAWRSIILFNCHPQTRELLILCSLFPETTKIPVEKLARYAKALELYDDIENLEGTRVRVMALLKKLKGSSLLLIDDKEKYVKLTAAVHELCLFVTSGKSHGYTEHRFIVKHQPELNVWPNNNEHELCTGISLGLFLHELPCTLDYPKLQILNLLLHTDLLNIPRIFFRKMNELRVLYIKHHSESATLLQVDALPPTPESLQNVRLLSLENCEFSGEGLSLIGSLKNLEILSFFSSKLDELPFQISELTNLKLLDLRTSENLNLIPSGVFSALKNLESLYLGNYDYWQLGDGQSGERMGISISELSTMSLLQTVQVVVRDPQHLLQWKGEVWFQKLRRFQIAATQKLLRFHECEIGKSLTFEKVDWSSLLDANISLLLRNAEGLKLKAATSFKNLSSVCAHLKTLKLFYCHDVKFLLDAGDSANAFNRLMHMEFRSMEGLEGICNGDLSTEPFSQLETVKLDCLPMLTHLWRTPIDSKCLGNLRVFKMSYCGAITGIFPQAVAKCLEQLQELVINSCDMLEGIIFNTGRDGAAEKIYFPYMTFLSLDELPKYRSFFPESKENQFTREKTTNHDTQGCGWFTQMQSAGEARGTRHGAPKGSENDDASTMHNLFNQLVQLPRMRTLMVRQMNSVKQIVDGQTLGKSIPGLEVMNVDNCEKLLSIAASDSIRDLNNLKQVTVTNCKSLEAVFDFRGVKVQDQGAVSMLRELETVSLRNLKSLMHVWQLVPAISQDFNNLKFLEISDCCSLGYVFSPSVAKTLQNLQHLQLKDLAVIVEIIEDGGGSSDLTDTIVLPNLCMLRLENLDSFRSFSSGNHNFDFPQLHDVFITDCPRMETFCRGQVTAQKLEQIKVGDQDGQALWKGDLNTTIQDLNVDR